VDCTPEDSSSVRAAGVAYALADAVRKGAEGKPSYLLLDLGIMVHEGMSLLLMPLAAPLFRREALMCADVSKATYIRSTAVSRQTPSPVCTRRCTHSRTSSSIVCNANCHAPWHQCAGLARRSS
jgi:hypothetical protein